MAGLEQERHELLAQIRQKKAADAGAADVLAMMESGLEVVATGGRHYWLSVHTGLARRLTPCEVDALFTMRDEGLLDVEHTESRVADLACY